MFVPNSEHFHLMKGILDVAVAIETRHVYKGAEIEWCVSGAAELSEVLELHNLSTSFIMDFLLDLFYLLLHLFGAGICVQML